MLSLLNFLEKMGGGCLVITVIWHMFHLSFGYLISSSYIVALCFSLFLL